MKVSTQFCTTHLFLVLVRVSVPVSVNTPQGDLFLKVGQKDESIILQKLVSVTLKKHPFVFFEMNTFHLSCDIFSKDTWFILGLRLPMDNRL